MSDFGEKLPERKTPEYGELAPEGWENNGGDSISSAPSSEPQAPAGQIPGVPHNLGVSDSKAAPVGTEARQSRAISYEPPTEPPTETRQQDSTATPSEHTPEVPAQTGSPQQQAPQPFQAPVSVPAATKNVPSSSTQSDKILTIVLLVLGALGALNLAGSSLNMGTALEMVAAAAGFEDFTLSPATAIVESMGAVAILSIFAAVLLWSIHRIRRKKRAFWVPLLGGAVALIVVFVFMFIALTLNPDLITNVNPETLEGIFRNMNL